VKSRVARARKTLLSILEGSDPLPGTPTGDDADPTSEIMAQLDRLAPAETRPPKAKIKKSVSE
jgi:hypothetical protein